MPRINYETDDFVLLEDVSAEENDCYVNPTCDEEDIPFEELFGNKINKEHVLCTAKVDNAI